MITSRALGLDLDLDFISTLKWATMEKLEEVGMRFLFQQKGKKEWKIYFGGNCCMRFLFR